PPPPTLVPYTTLFRSHRLSRRMALRLAQRRSCARGEPRSNGQAIRGPRLAAGCSAAGSIAEHAAAAAPQRSEKSRQAAGHESLRSEEHTSELQSRGHL